MSSLTHGVKKRISIMMTRKKTVEKNISAEYTTLKHAILRQKDTLEKAVEEIKKKAHSEFAASYKKFAELMSSDTPVDSPLYETTREATESANTIYEQSAKPLEAETAPARLIAHIEAYIKELKTVEKEFSGVERGFVEADRYERKVGKLAQRAQKPTEDTKGNEKVADKTRRNMDKLESERAAFNTKLESTIDMMKRTNGKYEKILECAHTAFWLVEEEFLNAVQATTKSVRDKCIASKEELVKLDITAM